MNPADFQARFTKLQKLISDSNLTGVALNPGPDLNYLTGLDFHLMERPIVGFFPDNGSPILVLPELESEKVAEIDFEILAYFYNEDQSTWASVFKTALDECGLNKGKLGVVPRRLRLLELSFIEQACPAFEMVSCQELMKEMRMIKSPAEIELISEAVRIAECALTSVISGIKPGITEKQLASRLVSRLLHEGSDPDLPFFPIVSFGENAANPHATPTDRILKSGDLVLIDFGAKHLGYVSDITRTMAMGDVNPELEQIAAFVLEANTAGRKAVRPGIPASQVDQITRNVIEKAGYGEYFFHRTGHGIGKEGHEEPYISKYDQTILEPGMTFTIEPGIYISGRGGVRIEDNVVVTPDGCQSITGFPRELTQLEIVE
jgi:Xaa-Pro dipeptidase